MDDLLTCSVCCEGYIDKQRPPVLLPRCGHSFCRPCVGLLMMKGCIVCPTCRTDQRIESANNLPTEYSLLAIINAQKNSQGEICERHNVKLSFWCNTCSIATCGECLFEDHPTHSHEVIRAKQYISNMKQLAHGIAFKFVDALDKREQHFYKTIYTGSKRLSNAIRNVGILRKDMDEARNLLRGGMTDLDSINTATSIAEAAKFLGLKWNIQDVNFNNKEKEEKSMEEKERESPAYKDEPESKPKEFPKKPEKKIIGRSKTMATLPNVQNFEEIDNNSTMDSNIISENKNKSQIKDKNDTDEVSENVTKDHTSTDLEKNTNKVKESINDNRHKEDNKTKDNEQIEDDILNSKPRGRLARKAVAAKKAELIRAAETRREEERKKKMKEEEEETNNKESENNVEAKIDENIPEKDQDTQISENTEEENSTIPKDEEPNISNEAESIEASAVETKNMDIMQVPGLQICVEGADGRLGRMEFGPEGIHVYCHQFQQLPYDVLIKSTILSALIPSKNPIVFMEISANETTVGRVYIELFGHMRRAHNFLTLCLGDYGASYYSTKFLQVYNPGEAGERILGGDYEYNNGRGGQGIIDDLEWNGDYAKPMQSGMITAAGSGQSVTNSLFLICTEGDENRNFSCPFGTVTSGLEYIREAILQSQSKRVWISDCGCLLKTPYV